MKKENISRICQDTILDYYDLLEQKQFEVNIQIPDTPIFALSLIHIYDEETGLNVFNF